MSKVGDAVRSYLGQFGRPRDIDIRVSRRYGTTEEFDKRLRKMELQQAIIRAKLRLLEIQSDPFRVKDFPSD